MQQSRHRRRGYQDGEKKRSLFGQPTAAFYRMPDLILRGGRMVTDGCRRVLDFTEQKICLDMGSVVVILYGEQIQIESLSRQRLVVRGRFLRIEFSRKWKGAEVCSANDSS